MILMAGVVVAATGLAGWLIPTRRRVTAAERERKRRMFVHARGRLGCARITDFRDGVIYYSYSVAGVEYSTAQDLTSLSGLVPEEAERLIEGPAGLKYVPRSPGNSIVACEEWSGLTKMGGRQLLAGTLRV